LKLVLRKEAVVWGALVLLASVVASIYELPVAVHIPVVVATGLLYALSLRTGQVCSVAAIFAVLALFDAPYARGLDRWYAWRGMVVVAIVVALAAAGFRIAIGKRALLPAAALD